MGQGYEHGTIERFLGFVSDLEAQDPCTLPETHSHRYIEVLRIARRFGDP